MKRRIVRYLLLRGSRDFESEEKYEEFLTLVLVSANDRRAERLGKELAAMREGPVPDLPTCRDLALADRGESPAGEFFISFNELAARLATSPTQAGRVIEALILKPPSPLRSLR